MIRERSRAIVVVVLTIALSLLLLQAALQLLCIWIDGRKFPAPGELLDLASRRVHVHSAGSGNPAIILEAGIAASSLNWSVLQPKLAEFTTVYSYDRAGLGWSTSTGQQCRLAQMADELREWIEAARIPAPYVLAGHSYAAYILRLYARRFPHDVAGIILIDPLTPEEWITP